MLVVLVKPHRSRLDPPEEPLAAALPAAKPQAAYHHVGPETTDHGYRDLRARAGRAGFVVLALVVKPAAWHAFGLLPAQQRFVEQVVAERPAVLAALGSPYVLDDYPGAAARLCAYSDVEVSQQALVEALRGDFGF
jgi:hypothetical protein